MHLRLLRIEANPHATMGVLLLDGRFFCYVLEDSIHPQTDDSKGPIPVGTYDVVITHSQRFGRDLPILVDVPGRSGIRFHPGNTEADTKGCILPGRVRTTDTVVESGTALALLQREIAHARALGERVTCSVEEVF